MTKSSSSSDFSLKFCDSQSSLYDANFPQFKSDIAYRTAKKASSVKIASSVSEGVGVSLIAILSIVSNVKFVTYLRRDGLKPSIFEHLNHSLYFEIPK